MRTGPLRNHTPRRKRGLRERVVDAERVIVDRRSGRVHQLNATASFIWERCDGTMTVSEIASQLAESYQLAVDQAERDVRRTVETLIDIELLTTAIEDEDEA